MKQEEIMNLSAEKQAGFSPAANGGMTCNSPLGAIERFRSGDLSVLKAERWLLYLAFPERNLVNLERIDSMAQAQKNYTLGYVERTLRTLDTLELPDTQKRILEETLKWAEVAKSGMAHQRRKWSGQGVNLFIHNIGSAQIYAAEVPGADSPRGQIIHTLIETHGLVGQFIRGEVKLSQSMPLHELTVRKLLSPGELSALLQALNFCVISAVSESLWQSIQEEVGAVINNIVQGRLDNELSLRHRIRALRSRSAAEGESFNDVYRLVEQNAYVRQSFEVIFKHCDLWYVEAALYDFSFEEFCKIFCLLRRWMEGKHIEHISFEPLMRQLYYDHGGRKRVNIYKKRIIEKYLTSCPLGDIPGGKAGETDGNGQISCRILCGGKSDDTAFFDFSFSPAGESLIAFCVEAENAGVLYEKAVVLLFDLFDLRRDAYDRFYEEENYLATMNSTIDYKKVLLEYIIGRNILDIGPGGGALMDQICARFHDAHVTGIDISQNVVDALGRKKQKEGRSWDIMRGDALALVETIPENSVDTVIFCSILHELYSYIERDGKKFNPDTVAAALSSAFRILSPGGRILIRDGIMTEPEEQKRRIRFASEDGMKFLKRYAADFRGREIRYQVIGKNEVSMPVNDAMEFLYTYTWGEESYVHEINEQFGYFTPSRYRAFIEKTLGTSAKILELRHYLQDGYTVALSQKIAFFDENGNPSRLPDSTCLIVIEKTR